MLTVLDSMRRVLLLLKILLIFASSAFIGFPPSVYAKPVMVRVAG